MTEETLKHLEEFKKKLRAPEMSNEDTIIEPLNIAEIHFKGEP